MIKSKSDQVVAILERTYPDAKTSLDYETPIQLAIAVIMSAQSTDKSVNLATPGLFKQFPTLDDLAEAKIGDLEECIRFVGFHHAKAKNIIGFARKLRDQFGGVLPKTVEELQTLPGVGRKTANVIQGVLHGEGKAEGIAVDTHVTRLSYRLGYTKETEPKKIEKDLMKWIDRNKYVAISHMLILHGRAICTARKAYCEKCALFDLCPKRGVIRTKSKPASRSKSTS